MDLTKIKVEEVKQEITPWKTPSGAEVRKIDIKATGYEKDKDGNDKTSKLKFYSHKKGTDEESVAYKGFKTGKIVAGVEVECKINESEPKSFVNDQKKTITYTDKWIGFFEDLSTLPDPGVKSVTIDSLPEAQDIPEEISAEEIPF